MYVSHLTLVDFRSYAEADLDLAVGATAFIGPNGQGKTNLVEAIDYVATQSSHRVATDQPLVRLGADQAIVRTTVQRDDRQALIELEINPGKSNRARLNSGDVPRPREVLGILRTVLFSPDDLDLVKGDPNSRRRFLDDLLVARQPRFAGVRSDYDRVLRQRNTLLKTAGGSMSGRRNEGSLATLEVWDTHLARAGAELLAARLALVEALAPHVARHYAEVAQAVPKPGRGNEATVVYKGSFDLERGVLEHRHVSALEAARDEATPSLMDREALTQGLLAEIARRRSDELDRGVSLVGPHRDDLLLSLGPLPTRGYASHGEAWSLALAMRLAAFELLRAEGDDPVLILDDVFAELDEVRRRHLADLVAKTEQVLVTAAVRADVPAELIDQRFDVRDGGVTRA
ncbi:MAG: DNA replication/repair protein RecF [Actinomycetota bacterium]|nr:DNA replication/repair protein RecF [Actinomycetota bacterium]